MLDGTDISRLPEKQLARLRNEKIGLVFQAFNLIPPPPTSTSKKPKNW